MNPTSIPQTSACALIEYPSNAGAGNSVEKGAGAQLSWKQKVQRLHKQMHVFYFAFKHPQAPWYAKLVAACAAGYLFSPVQLIPSYIPVIGFLDDFAVLFLGAKILRRIIPAEVWAQCQELAEVAEIRRREEIRSTPAIVTSIVIIVLWLLVAVGSGMLMVKYIIR
jgi:uncharacterized membrane protein YkvA (DUF1232 family)